MLNAKFESKTAFGRQKRISEDNIGMGVTCSSSKHYSGDHIKNEIGQVCDKQSSGKKNAYRVLVRKPKEKDNLENLRTQEDNIKVGRKQTIRQVWTCFTWIMMWTSGWFQ